MCIFVVCSVFGLGLEEFGMHFRMLGCLNVCIFRVFAFGGPVLELRIVEIGIHIW